MPGADDSALLDDGLGNVLRRTSNELFVAERESAGGRRSIGHVRVQAFVFRHEAFQAIGHRRCIDARLLAGRRHSHTPPQRKALGPAR